ncbi:MAG: hypothetical protein QOC66_1488 [Pseudonocardiales bacterium]|jgi:hypothetical protein|nr:hypothetical protein [Pseudonocardiales bacterium]
MNDDDRFGAVLHRAVSTLEPPTERLVAGAIARGRRRRRIVLAGELATGGVLVAGVLALVVALVPDANGSRTGTSPAGKPADPAPAAAGRLPMSPQALAQTALETLPRRGATTNFEGSADAGSVSTAFTYDDGHGGAQIVIAMQYPVPGASPKVHGPILPCARGSEGCIVLSDGAHARTARGHEYDDGRQPNAAEWVVDLVRRDGVQVSILEYNAPRQKGAAISRPAPPFTLDELTTWANDDLWQTTITSQRAKAAVHLFEPAGPKAQLSGLAATKSASRLEREATDRLKAADLARKRASCAAAAAQHATLPKYCAQIN